VPTCVTRAPISAASTDEQSHDITSASSVRRCYTHVSQSINQSFTNLYIFWSKNTAEKKTGKSENVKSLATFFLRVVKILSMCRDSVQVEHGQRGVETRVRQVVRRISRLQARVPTLALSQGQLRLNSTGPVSSRHPRNTSDTPADILCCYTRMPRGNCSRGII